VTRPPGVPLNARPFLQRGGYTIWVKGTERARLRDAYHTYLRVNWGYALGAIAAGFFAINIIFAFVFTIVGGVDGVSHGSFFDALMFSVETLGTIGYGVMHPTSTAANVVVIIESITGIVTVALITGLVFSKFSRATARVAFSKDAVICMYEGKPCLMFRCGNERSNTIVEAKMHVVLSMTTKDDRGQPFFRLHDLKLVRHRMGGMRRGWTVMHRIDETSPLYQFTAEDILERECELECAMTGFDDVTLQTVYAMYAYNEKQILMGRRLADTLTIFEGGDLMFDITKFHDTLPDDAPAATNSF
jgi:inward rectifier potassium channel